jgi:hypothetical protein
MLKQLTRFVIDDKGFMNMAWLEFKIDDILSQVNIQI